MSGQSLRLPCIPSHICPSILQPSLHTGWTAEVWLFRGPVTPEQATSMWVAAKCCLRQCSSWNWLGPYQSCGICGFHSRCGFSFFEFWGYRFGVGPLLPLHVSEHQRPLLTCLIFQYHPCKFYRTHMSRTVSSKASTTARSWHLIGQPHFSGATFFGTAVELKHSHPLHNLHLFT